MDAAPLTGTSQRPSSAPSRELKTPAWVTETEAALITGEPVPRIREWLASSPIATTSLTIQRKPPLSLRLLRIDDLRLAISSPSAAYRTTRRSPDPVGGASDEKRRRLRRRWLSIAIAIISLAVVALFLAWLPQLGDRGLEGDHRHLPGTAQPTPRNAHAMDPRSASTGTNQPQGQPSFALPGQAQVIASSSGSGDVLVTFA